MTSTPLQNLVCYLYKEDINSFENLFKVVDGNSMKENFEEVPLKDGLELDIKGYIQTDKASPPKWVSKLSPIFNFNDHIYNTSNSFVFFVKVKNRIFAYTMGYAHHSLNKSKIEYDFGLKVTLNEISDTQIRGLDVRKLSATSHQKREVSTSDSGMRDFDFDFNEEFINSLMGKARDSAVANTLIGKESLKVSVNLNIEDIVDYSNNLLQSYSKVDYKENFEFIDKLKVVKDDEVWSFFKTQLLYSFQNVERNKILIAYPYIEDFAFHNYKITYSRKSKLYVDINTDILFDFIEKKAIDLSLLNLESFGVSLMDDDNKVVNRYNLLDYVVYEFEKDGKKYIYSSHQIFEIDTDYFNTIIEEIDKYELGLIDSSIDIPEIHFKDGVTSKGKPKIEIENEGKYNLRFVAANEDNCICLDKQNFRNFQNRKNDQVEICDIVTKDRELICVKTYKNSSAALSHLMMQGIVSAELLVECRDYRKKLKNSVKHKFSNFINIDSLIRSEITFVYAICIVKDGRIANNLPFFSKISLRQSIKNLLTLGFNVKLMRIPFKKLEDI